ncbi:MAG: biopolymer transporter ExbD [Candidatus Hydrogenedentes bacterium]|nr:biopolymer transporter ExbD [Candidatus Hydrogenedentota bacterium]
MKFPRNSTRKIRASVEMTPLIDVVFQLLIFFMLSSTFVVQTSIPIEVPEATGATQSESKDVSISLKEGDGGPDNGGEVFIDSVPVTNWTQLTRFLVELNERDPDALVLIRAAKKVPTERLVKVLGLANGVGIKNYGIAATPPTEEK